MSDHGFAWVTSDGRLGGWEPTPTGQIERATSPVDKVRRLQRPFWGPVWSERYRGNAPAPKKAHDAIDAVNADRLRLLLSPMTDAGEIADLEASSGPHPTDPERRMLLEKFRDGDKRPYRLSETVRIP